MSMRPKPARVRLFGTPFPSMVRSSIRSVCELSSQIFFHGRRKFGISKNTIVGAYERLVADGHVVPKAGSGFIVVYGGDSENGARPKHVTEAVDIASLLSAQLSQNFQICVGDGRPPASWTEQSEIRRHWEPMEGFCRRMQMLTGPHSAFLPLRQQIARRLNAQEIQAGEDNLLLTF